MQKVSEYPLYLVLLATTLLFLVCIISKKNNRLKKTKRELEKVKFELKRTNSTLSKKDIAFDTLLKTQKITQEEVNQLQEDLKTQIARNAHLSENAKQ
jgi:predicted transcriptional regulator